MSMGKRVYLTVEEIKHIQMALHLIDSSFRPLGKSAIAAERSKDIMRVNDKVTLKIKRASERQGV